MDKDKINNMIAHIKYGITYNHGDFTSDLVATLSDTLDYINYLEYNVKLLGSVIEEEL